MVKKEKNWMEKVRDTKININWIVSMCFYVTGMYGVYGFYKVSSPYSYMIFIIVSICVLTGNQFSIMDDLKKIKEGLNGKNRITKQ